MTCEIIKNPKNYTLKPSGLKIELWSQKTETLSRIKHFSSSNHKFVSGKYTREILTPDFLKRQER